MPPPTGQVGFRAMEKHVSTLFPSSTSSPFLSLPNVNTTNFQIDNDLRTRDLIHWKLHIGVMDGQNLYVHLAGDKNNRCVYTQNESPTRWCHLEDVNFVKPFGNANYGYPYSQNGKQRLEALIHYYFVAFLFSKRLNKFVYIEEKFWDSFRSACASVHRAVSALKRRSEQQASDSLKGVQISHEAMTKTPKRNQSLQPMQSEKHTLDLNTSRQSLPQRSVLCAVIQDQSVNAATLKRKRDDDEVPIISQRAVKRPFANQYKPEQGGSKTQQLNAEASRAQLTIDILHGQFKEKNEIIQQLRFQERSTRRENDGLKQMVEALQREKQASEQTVKSTTETFKAEITRLNSKSEQLAKQLKDYDDKARHFKDWMALMPKDL